MFAALPCLGFACLCCLGSGTEIPRHLRVCAFLFPHHNCLLYNDLGSQILRPHNLDCRGCHALMSMHPLACSALCIHRPQQAIVRLYNPSWALMCLTAPAAGLSCRPVTHYKATNKVMLCYRTLTRDLGQANHNDDYIAERLRNELLPGRCALTGRQQLIGRQLHASDAR